MAPKNSVARWRRNISLVNWMLRGWQWRQSAVPAPGAVVGFVGLLTSG